MPDAHPEQILTPDAMHFDRAALADEFHARPPLPIMAPAHIQVLCLHDPYEMPTDQIDPRNKSLLDTLCQKLFPASASHKADSLRFCRIEEEQHQIKFERHNEYSSFIITSKADINEPQHHAPGNDVLAPFLDLYHHQIVTALIIHVLPGNIAPPDDDALRHFFGHDDYVGTAVSGGHGLLWTDFMIGPDGMGRILVQNKDMSPRRCGRLIQRIIDIETYRILAMAALPMVQQISDDMARLEQGIIDITESMIREQIADPVLLDRLVALATRHEHIIAYTRRRFAATQAYRALVDRRLMELREDRIEGLQRISVFIERRFGPAMRTVESGAQRQIALTAQIRRTTELLQTRVEVALETQNQQLLRSMDMRTAHQLRLQEAVEGLSLFAISYYLLGLIKYGAETLEKLGLPIKATIVPGIALPFVFGALLLGKHCFLHHQQKTSSSQ